MEYSEVEFMLSEMNNWDQGHYIAGTEASINHWRDVCTNLEGWDAERVNAFNAERDAYIAALPPASKSTVMAQKYLSFYDQAYQAWFEHSRTGEPKFLLNPGEQTSVDLVDGKTPIYFEPLITIPHSPGV
jgi:Starch-binding associating with outer membrane